MMPTGYTADVADGKITDLAPFAMQIARGMGACIMMRDMPMDTPIPERFEPSDYNAKRLEEAKAERARLYAMTGKEAQNAADAEFAEWSANRDKSKAEHVARRRRYESMIEKAEAWMGAPEGVKEFALEQLRSGMDFDCREPWSYYSEAPAVDGNTWKTAALIKVNKDIEYHAVQHAKEVERTEGRNAWIAQLRKSLAQVPA